MIRRYRCEVQLLHNLNNVSQRQNDSRKPVKCLWEFWASVTIKQYNKSSKFEASTDEYEVSDIIKKQPKQPAITKLPNYKFLSSPRKFNNFQTFTQTTAEKKPDFQNL